MSAFIRALVGCCTLSAMVLVPFFIFCRAIMGMCDADKPLDSDPPEFSGGSVMHSGCRGPLLQSAGPASLAVRVPQRGSEGCADRSA